ncbi:MAG TPA: phosphotransferase [Gemmatimonadaceae bacterium]|nr:phosphotransferase [Gemmatimonadaceae bacterium]
MIPEERQLAVAGALDQAFGVREFDEIRPLTGGLSTALVFRIVVRNHPYLLRLVMPGAPSGDPAGQFASLQTAAAAGLAPHIWYVDMQDGVLIADFVEARPFPADVGLRLAPIFRRVHSLRGFQKPKIGNYFDAMDRLVSAFRTANILPQDNTDELFRRYAELMKVYPRGDSELVASHNDVKPQNIIFDGDRLWLVDWEAAFLNDRYVDLAIAANFFVQHDQETAYLDAYFGAPADPYQHARFYLMRQALHVFYAAMLIVTLARSGAHIDPEAPASDFQDFHRRLISGEVSLATPDEKLEYARVHLAAAQRQVRTRRFEESLALVAGVAPSL